MKNIVILKDLPSNLVEEAIVFLKENQKLKKPELIDIEVKKTNGDRSGKENQTKERSQDYIVHEAQMLIAEYISKIENKNRKEDISYKKLKKKYDKLKSLSGFLAISLFISILINFII